MFESFLIVFRESLEMALIVGIILVYLKRTNKTKHNNAVYLGITAGVGVSALVAYLVSIFFEKFEGRNEEIFEGVLMLIAAGLLTSMIFWFLRQQSSIRKNLENKIATFWDRWAKVGLFLVVFFAILREGVETVLFMSAIFIKSDNVMSVSLSGFAGMFAALVLGYLIFVLGKKVNLKYFFKGSNILLMLFAAGLMAHGVHELQEAHLLPTYVEHLFDVNHILDENGGVGSLMKALFGYNGNPSLVEVSVYVLYLVGVLGWERRIRRQGMVVTA